MKLRQLLNKLIIPLKGGGIIKLQPLAKSAKDIDVDIDDGGGDEPTPEPEPIIQKTLDLTRFNFNFTPDNSDGVNTVPINLNNFINSNSNNISFVTNDVKSFSNITDAEQINASTIRYRRIAAIVENSDFQNIDNALKWFTDLIEELDLEIIEDKSSTTGVIKYGLKNNVKLTIQINTNLFKVTYFELIAMGMMGSIYNAYITFGININSNVFTIERLFRIGAVRSINNQVFVEFN